MFCIDFLLFSFLFLFFSFFFLKKEVKKRKLPIQPEAALSFFDFGLVQIPCLMYIYICIYIYSQRGTYLILPTVRYRYLGRSAKVR